MNDLLLAILEAAEFTFTGRTGRDTESKFFDNGKQKARTSIAVQIAKDQSRWFTVEAWGDEAQQLADVPKGKVIRVTGRVTIDRYQKRDGTDGVAYVIKARTVEDVYGDAFGAPAPAPARRAPARAAAQAPAWQTNQEDLGDDSEPPF